MWIQWENVSSCSEAAELTAAINIHHNEDQTKQLIKKKLKLYTLIYGIRANVDWCFFIYAHTAEPPSSRSPQMRFDSLWLRPQSRWPLIGFIYINTLAGLQGSREGRSGALRIFYHSMNHHHILITRRSPAVKLYIGLVSITTVDVLEVYRDVKRLKVNTQRRAACMLASYMWILWRKHTSSAACMFPLC